MTIENGEVIDSLKKFAELADNNVLDWQILLGKKVIQIQQSREGKVNQVKHYKDVLSVNVVFRTTRGISSEDYSKKDFLEQFNLCSSISIPNYIKDSPSKTISNPTKELHEHIESLLSVHKFSKAERFYKRECQDLITLKEYQKKEDAQKQISIKKLHNYLEQYQFDEANDFYKNYCEGYIHHETDYCKKKKECEKRFKDSLLSDLDILLSRYEYDEAEDFFHRKCIPFISIDEYKTKKSLFLQELTRIHQPLFEILDTLLNEYSFDKADEFYNTQCSKYLLSAEYDEKRKLFWEKKRRIVFSELCDFFKENFLLVQDFYVNECSKYITKDEYEFHKKTFVQSWINENLGNKPDLEQSLAIGEVNNHIQVIARAGSGKTSTLVSRAVFLQKHCDVKASEILLLAFNRKASEEIGERLKKYLHNELPYSLTFHALSHALVKPSENLVYDETGGNQAQSRLMQSVINDYLRNSEYYEQIKSLMIAKFKQAWNQVISTKSNLTPQEKEVLRRTNIQTGIDGRTYRSGGEKVIADFLFEHNLPYIYEKNFWWNIGNERVNYRPDFTVLKKVNGREGIVIEYFGLQGDPNYDEQSERKRRYWQNHSNYFFIEINPKQLKENGRNGLEELLKIELNELGLQFTRLSQEELWAKIDKRAITRFDKAMTNFIGRCRKICWTPDDLSEKISKHDFNPNSSVDNIERQFLELAQDFYVSYLELLKQRNEDDFDGIMQRSAQVVNQGHTKFRNARFGGDLKNIKYIMIDEYQDFSLLFYNLIDAIRNQNPQALFFCVGDDWQAINSFAGSDLHYYNNFANLFTPSKQLKITTNYRSYKKIVEIGNKLMVNRGNLAKTIKPDQGKIYLADITKFQMTTIEEAEHGFDLTAAVIRLVNDLISSGKKVTLLSRNNNLQKAGYIETINNEKQKINGLELIEFHKYIQRRLNLTDHQKSQLNISTAHSYKGKENQVIIILDVDRYGSIHPEAIFYRIFGDDVDKLIEDERRLLYVSLTRAEQELYIVTDSDSPSMFIAGLKERMQLEELNWQNYKVPKNKNRQIVIRVSNQRSNNPTPTTTIREFLVSEGYNFSGQLQSWSKIELASTFTNQNSFLQFILNSNWAENSHEVQVDFLNEQEQVIAFYISKNGNWTCGSDNFISQTNEKARERIYISEEEGWIDIPF